MKEGVSNREPSAGRQRQNCRQMGRFAISRFLGVEAGKGENQRVERKGKRSERRVTWRQSEGDAANFEVLLPLSSLLSSAEVCKQASRTRSLPP